MKRNQTEAGKTTLSVLRWQISRVYRDLDPGDAESDTQPRGNYLEITINPPSGRNQFLALLNLKGQALEALTADQFREITYDALVYWFEEEKMGYLFETELMDYIRNTGRSVEELGKRTIEEDMVFILIGPRKALRSFYRSISVDSIGNLNDFLKSGKNSGAQFRIVDITPQARKMASGIYNKALKNRTSGDRESTS